MLEEALTLFHTVEPPPPPNWGNSHDMTRPLTSSLY